MLTPDGAQVLGRLAEIAHELAELEDERRVLVRVAVQHGCRIADIASVTGLARPTVTRWAGR